MDHPLDPLPELGGHLDRLQQELARLRAAVTVVDAPLLQLDLHGTILDANGVARSLVGEVVGRPFAELMPAWDSLASVAKRNGIAVGQIQPAGRPPLGVRLAPVAGGGFACALVAPPELSAETQALAAAEAWAPIMRIHTTLDGYIQQASPRACQWLGYGEQGLLGFHFSQLTHPADLELSRDRFQRISSGAERSLTLEKRYLTRTGQVLWAELNCALVSDGAGRPLYVVNFLRDITEQKLAEEALQRELARIKAVFEHSPAGIIFTDADQCQLEWNSAALAMHGIGGPAGPRAWRPDAGITLYTREGTPLAEAEWPLKRALRGEAVEGVELLVERQDRSFRRHLLYSAAAVCEARGRETIGVLMCVDVTRLREAERALAHKTREIEALLAALPIPVQIAHDRVGGQMSINAACAELLGLTAEGGTLSIQGACPVGVEMRLNGRPLAQADRPALVAAREGCATAPQELELVGLNGRISHVYGRAVPVLDEWGEVTGGIALFVDITERRRMEEALRASEARERARAAELAAIFEAIPTPIWIAEDPHCRTILGSRAAYEVLRVRAGSNISLSAPSVERPTGFEVWSGGRRLATAELPVQRAARGEVLRGFEEEIRFTDGEVRYLSGNAVPLLDETGAPRGAIGAFVDITARKRAEQALAASETRERARAEELELLLKALPAIVLIAHDRDAAVVSGSLEAHRLLQVPLGGNLSKRSQEGRALPSHIFINGEPVASNDLPLHRAARGEWGPQQELELHLADGEVRFISGGAVPLLHHGEPRGAVAAFVDITRAKLAERALAESEATARARAAELAAVLQALPAAVFITSDGECRQLTCNSFAQRLLGLPSAELPAADAMNALHCECNGDQLIPTGLPIQRAARGEWVGPQELEMARQDGQRLILSGSAVPLLDSAGRPRGAVAAFIDISARRRAEEALRESEQRERQRAAELAAILEGAPVAIFIAREPDCRLIESNRAGHELLGLEEIAASVNGGRPLPSYGVLDRNRPQRPEAAPLERVVATAVPLAFEQLELRRADGHLRFVAGNAVPLLDELGAVRGAVAAFLDVTERVETERALLRKNRELERANTDLEEFAYAASHDLKAPLRAVSQLADWLLEELSQGLDPDNRERLRLLRARVVRMDNLINGLLAYARLGYHTPADPGPVALEPLLREVLASLDLPPSFVVELEPPLPELEADPLHLIQLFQNLIGNAVRHHDLGRGRVVIRAQAAGEWWRLEVADDGPGIPLELRPQVFKMFTTLRRRDETEHTGIGLALVKKLVTRYGGEVWVEGNAPRGAVFVFTWPR